jgi:Mn-containing catalase
MTSACSFEAKPERPDPIMARRVQELIGGQYGEITVMNQYLFQGWNCRHPGKYKDLIMDTGVEEIGPVEMLATMVARLLEGAPLETSEAAMASEVSIAAVIGGMDPSTRSSPALGPPPRLQRRALVGGVHHRQRQPAGRLLRQR